jgi:AsmA protein
MRKIIIIALAVCGFIILALALIPRVVDVNQYHGRIQAELQSRLGRPVTLGKISLSLLPPSLQVQDVAIGEDPDFGTAPFAKAQGLSVRVSLIPLLKKDVEIQSLRLINPEIQLILNRKGGWNYASLGQGTGTPGTGEAKSGTQVSLVLLEIRNGRLHLRDEQKNSENTYDNIDVTLKNFAPGRPFEVDAAVHIAGKGDQQIQVKGAAGPMAGGSASMPFDGTVDLKQVSIADLSRAAGISALSGYGGALSGSLKAKTENGVIRSDGSFKIDDPQIQNTKLGVSIALEYALSDDLQKGVISLEKGTLHLGPMPVTIAGSLNAASTPAQIDLHVATQGASLTGIARLAAAAGVAFNAGTEINGKLDAEIAARGPANNPALSGQIRVGALEISGGEIKQPVSIPALEISLTPAAITSNLFAAKTGSTLVNGQFTLKDYTGPAPAIQARLTTENASVAELLSMARAYGAAAVEGLSGSGQLSLSVSAAGPARNPSALEFSGGGTLQNVTLHTPSLTKPLNVKHATMKFSQNSMMLDNLAASLDQTNAGGNLSIRNFTAPQLQFDLNIDKMDVAALQQIFSAPPVPAKRTGLTWVPNAYAGNKAVSEPGLMEKALGNGTITIGLLKYDQLVLTDVKSNVTLDRGVIRLGPLSSSVYAGQQTGEITLDTRQNPPAVSVNLKMQKVDGNKLLSSVSSVRDTLYGLIAANANARFSAGGASNFAQSLNGQLSLDLGNGRLAKIDLLNQLASIGKFLGGPAASQQPFTDVTKLNGTFTVVNGLAETNDLKAVIPGANLAAKGTANLATNALNMHLTAVLSKEFSQKVGGTSVGGFMQTALANSNGELVMPVLVTGTLDQPRFAPDLQEVARMKLQNLLPSFGNPGSLSSGILGAIMGGKKGQDQPANPLLDLLDAVKKKKEQKPPNPPPPN